MNIEPLAPALGARITGIELGAALSEDTVAAVRDAWARHGVLVFPGQAISDAAHVAFSRHFGELELFPQADNRADLEPEIFKVSNVGPDDELMPVEDERWRYLTLTYFWHTDSSYRPIPSRGAILHGIEVVPEGGETWFANLRAVYAAMPEAMKARVRDLKAVHSFEYSRSLRQLSPMKPAEAAAVPPVEHRLVRRHPGGGAASLYISAPYMREIVGLNPADSRALIDELVEFATQDRFLYKHLWSPHDVLMWDNTWTMHLVTPFEAARHRRVMHRTAIQGTEPVH